MAPGVPVLSPKGAWIMPTDGNNRKVCLFEIATVALGVCLPAIGQSPERDALDVQQGRITTIDAGTPVPVRIKEDIYVETRSEQVFRGMVAEDVRDAKGHIAIPRGSPVDLKVRVGPDQELVLDLESINVNTQRFGAWSETDQVEAYRRETLLATVVDPAPGLEVRGPAIRVPADSVVTFRIDHALIVGVQFHEPGEPLYARQNLQGLR
jgi:hypothetical protein